MSASAIVSSWELTDIHLMAWSLEQLLMGLTPRPHNDRERLEQPLTSSGPLQLKNPQVRTSAESLSLTLEPSAMCVGPSLEPLAF